MIEKLPNVHYAKAPRGFGPSYHNWPPRLIVIHKTANDATAEQEANYSAHRLDDRSHWTSAHFIIDHNGIVGSVPLNMQAWAARNHGNAIGWQIEICGPSTPTDFDLVELRHAARIVHELATIAHLPLVKLTPWQVRAGKRGICGHIDITKAYPEDHGTHTDPGWTATEWVTFMEMVKTAGYRYVTTEPFASPPPWNSTLSGIALQEGTTVAHLLALNPWIINQNVIPAHVRIRVE